jgi:hypothetical protein
VSEIDTALQTCGLCGSQIKFTKVAEAAEFRKTLAKEREGVKEENRVAV